eukprot:gb/GFBE01038626.1/.p1 GENE.gb/GFBE01038626.1/~~gb/GFBE01038626.1/.p1  ORF type:complete len:224 (+),score=50.33 gb/GFBE01038626.1/:1-672(+)
MYSLRGINNMFSEHAGTRSDFIIVGHPEFREGKVTSCSREFSAWDNRKQPTRPAKCIARTRSNPVLTQQLYSPGPIGSLKERALSKSMSKMEVLPASPRGGISSSFDAFEKALREVAKFEEAAPKREQKLRTAANVATAKGHSATCRNFAQLHKEVRDIQEKLKANPKQTRENLIATGAWKYYATHLEQTRQLESQLRRDRQKAAPLVKTLCEEPTGMMSKTH